VGQPAIDAAIRLSSASEARVSWTSMHFAVGMVGGAAVTAGVACFCRRALPLTPLGMTLGGLWAIVPDTPRLIRVDFPSLRSLPGVATLGDKAIEARLHQVGDLFFLHRTLDLHANDLSLAGLFAMIGLYTLGLAALVGLVAWQRARIARLERRLQSHALPRPAVEPPVDRRRATPSADPPRPGEPVPRRRQADWHQAG